MVRKRKFIVIAPTVAEGEAAYPDAVAVVTPRAAEAARGIVADRVLVMDSMREHDKLAELLEASTPSLETTGRARPVFVSGTLGPVAAQLDDADEDDDK